MSARPELPTPAEVATAERLRERLLTRDALGEALWKVALTVEPASPWLAVVFERFGPYEASGEGKVTFVIWRRTGNAYPIGPDGAVADEPIIAYEQ